MRRGLVRKKGEERLESGSYPHIDKEVTLFFFFGVGEEKVKFNEGETTTKEDFVNLCQRDAVRIINLLMKESEVTPSNIAASRLPFQT